MNGITGLVTNLVDGTAYNNFIRLSDNEKIGSAVKVIGAAFGAGFVTLTIYPRAVPFVFIVTGILTFSYLNMDPVKKLADAASGVLDKAGHALKDVLKNL